MSNKRLNIIIKTQQPYKKQLTQYEIQQQQQISRVTSPVNTTCINWACATAHASINLDKLNKPIN